MLQNTKYDIFSHDNSCIIAVVENEQGHSRLVSPINFKYERPINESWALDNSIIHVEDSLIKTKISLADITSNITFIAQFSIDSSKISYYDIDRRSLRLAYSEKNDIDFSSCRLNLFKQGTDNINGVVDIHINVAKCKDGIFCELIADVYYQRTSTINRERITYEFDDVQIDDLNTVSLSMNPYSYFAELCVNGILKKSYSLNIFHALGLKINDPFIDSKENRTLTIGDTKKALHLRSAMIFNKYISPQYISSVQRAVS